MASAMDTDVAAFDRAALTRLPDRLRLPLSFDADALARDLAALTAQPWTPHFVAANYAGDWAVLPLRIPQGSAALHPILRATSTPATTAWEDSALLAGCPAFAAVIAAFGPSVGAARLMRLTPGSAIHEHRDPDLAPEHGFVRLHVPVATDAGVDFRLNGTRVTMAVGDAWYLRLADRHAVTHRGTRDRVHLVIDAAVDDRIAALLLASAHQNSPRTASPSNRAAGKAAGNAQG